MDNANRKRSLQMVIDFLRKARHKQSIIITPLEMVLDDELKGPDIHIWEMNAPTRAVPHNQ
jgi:hypothetical protein